VTPSVTIITDDVSDDGSSSAGAIAAGVSVAVVVIIAIIGEWSFCHLIGIAGMEFNNILICQVMNSCY